MESIMILASRHLTDYIDLPEHFVIRINLAWEHDIEELLGHIAKLKNDIFLDIPIDRKKPPNNEWELDEIFGACKEESSIKYIAISNVEKAEDIDEWYDCLKRHNLEHQICIVPKIESVQAATNIGNILIALPSPNLMTQKTIMIDHDDMFSDIVKLGLDSNSLYTDYIIPIVRACKRRDVRVLRTAGIVFTDT